MSIQYERISRTITEDGPPVAVCDGCGKREPAIEDGMTLWVDYPEGWMVFWQRKAGRPRHSRPDLKGVCSWACLAAYGERQGQVSP